MDEVISNYFRSLNPLAAKIFLEIDKVSLKYGDKWKELSLNEQEAILDNYFFNGKQIDSVELKQLLIVESGTKVVVDFDQDELGWTWTDEHSGPFSWKTKSQQDLTLGSIDLLSEEISKSRPTSTKEKKVLEKVESSSSVQQIIKSYQESPVVLADSKINIELEQKSIRNNSAKIEKNVSDKVTTLRALKEGGARVSYLNSAESSSPVSPPISKQPNITTGFDFLDNW